jgi:hypothetical protein
MKITAQVGESPDRWRQFARYNGHEAVVGSHGDAAMKLARVMIAAGYDPASEYVTARGEWTAMRYSSLGYAARLTVWETNHGPKIVPFEPLDPDDVRSASLRPGR